MTTDKQQNKFQQPGRVKTVKGSIVNPENAGLRFILSVNNLAGKLDGNPMLPIFEKKWPKVKAEARGWYATRTGAYKLGAVNTTAVQSDTWVIHMLCQGEDLSVDTVGLTKCLKEVCKMAKYERATVHVSTALTNSISELTDSLVEELVNQGVAVSFYEEPNA
jgi:hypothetical protein